MKRLIIVLLGFAVLAIGCSTAAVHGSTPPEHSPGMLATVTHSQDIEVTACFGNVLPTPAGCTPGNQVVLTTQPIVLDGSPVEVTFTLEYVNEIPDTAQVSNGIGFDLYMDGVYIERMSLYGEHNLTPAMSIPLFGPVTLDSVLDAGKTPSAGTHTFALGVWKWQPHADGYLRAGDDAAGNGLPKPMRLTVRYA